MNISNRLEIKNLSAGYDSQPIISDISLSVPAGQTVSIIGLSGTGKTTLFNAIAGIITPYGGQVLLDGIDITGSCGHISYMLQKDLLLPFRTAIDNIALPLIIKGASKKSAYEQILPQLEKFGLADKKDAYPHELSGGMRQRVALLRTYMFSGKAVLLDEPFSALDSITRAEIQDWYMSIMDSLHLTTVLITHDIDEAVLLSDRVCILSGSPATISYSIDIELPMPRSNTDPDFVAIKRRLLDKLRA